MPSEGGGTAACGHPAPAVASSSAIASVTLVIASVTLVIASVTLVIASVALVIRGVGRAIMTPSVT
jgi:hypothetical protein